MAKVPVTALDFEIGGTDYSAQIKNCKLDVSADTEDTTDFASSGWKEHVGTLKSGNISFEAQYDDLSTLEAALFAAIGTVVTFQIEIDGGSATSATNPKFTGSMVVKDHSVGGAVGGVHGGSFTYPTTGAITRATA